MYIDKSKMHIQKAEAVSVAQVVMGDNHNHSHFHEHNTIIYKASLKVLSLADVKYWNLPPKVKYFISRNSLIEKIDENLVNPNITVTVLSALQGMGGVGKTTLANHLIHEREYSFKAWFNAKSISELQKQFIDLGSECRLYEETEKLSNDAAVKRVLKYLESHQDWLLVYDNVGKYEEIINLLPKKGGHILVTSRHYNWPEDCIVEIDVMSIEEARDLVRKITKTNEEDAILNELVEKKLGLLPLAISQACGYMIACSRTIENKKIPMSVATYLNKYNQYAKNLLKENRMPPGNEVQLPVFFTWKINTEEISKQSPEAIILLNACAFLDAVEIPEEILIKYLERKQIINKLEYKYENGIKLLSDYSLIKVHAKTLSLHRLVQTVTRFNLKRDQALNIMKDLSLAFVTEFKENTQVVLNKQRNLLFHLDVILNEIIFRKEQEFIFCEIFDKCAGIHLASRVQDEIRKGIFYFEYSLEIRRKHSTMSPLEIANSLKDLADSYYYLGGIDEMSMARHYFEKVLDLKESLPKEHPIISKVFIGLGNVFRYLGANYSSRALDCYREAIKHHKNVTEIYERNRKTKHLLAIAMALHNSGNVYVDSGGRKNIEKGIVYIKASLRIREQNVKGDLVIGASYHCLGIAYWSLGGEDNLKQAIWYFEGTLKIWENEKNGFGKEHRYVARVFTTFCLVYYDLKNLTEAKTYNEKALKMQLDILGRMHEETALSLYYSGSIYMEEGNLAQGIPLIQEAIVIFRKTAPCGNRFVQIVYRNLKKWLIKINNETKLQDQILKEIDSFMEWASSHFVYSVEKIPEQDLSQKSIQISSNNIGQPMEDTSSYTQTNNIGLSMYGIYKTYTAENLISSSFSNSVSSYTKFNVSK